MQTRDQIASHSARIILLVTAMFCAVTPAAATSLDNASPTLLSEVVTRQAAQLAAIDSNAGAMALFTSAIGPSLGLKDAAGILGARGLSAKVANELGLPELSQSAHELMAALAAWRLAESIYRSQSSAPSSTSSPEAPSQAQQEWMNGTARLSNLADFFRLMTDQPPSDSSSAPPPAPRPQLLLTAHQVAFEAYQRALASWWSLHEWKERVRQARGLTRLCGTWQWTIHNHQNHSEQKLAVTFPPAGQRPPNVPLPVETIVLGDSIYLRWERSGYVQEDSLLFVSEGHKRDALDQPMKIEGSFANNTGGWGPISGKRTADCQP
jgi:hypothetical protein